MTQFMYRSFSALLSLALAISLTANAQEPAGDAAEEERLNSRGGGI